MTWIREDASTNVMNGINVIDDHMAQSAIITLEAMKVPSSIAL